MTKAQKIAYSVLTAAMVGSMLGFIAAANHMDFVFQIADFAFKSLAFVVGLAIGLYVAYAIAKGIQS